MGAVAGTDIDAWLKRGGLVVAASERAARALAAAYNHARRAEGLTAWPAANILDWQSFVCNAWAERSGDGRMILSSFQEQSLWTEIVGAEGQGTILLEGPRRQLAALAMDAHRLLCVYAPRYLSRTARGAAWQQDAAAFSAWLSAFDQACKSAELLSEARLPLDLLRILETDSAPRPALLLAGFDRILPVQRRVFDVWGQWTEAKLEKGEPGKAESEKAASRLQFHQAVDASSELAACARWCKLQLEANPRARLLVVTQNVSQHRGEIERVFLRFTGNGAAPLFEFSLGVPLRQVSLPRGVHLLLRWLSEAIEERELDWLFSTGQIAADAAEARALTAFMRGLRLRGMERTRWPLDDFIAQQRRSLVLPEHWTERMKRAKLQLEEARRSIADPLRWAELVPRLLESAGWLGARPLTSAEFQALRRWQQALDSCASLGFNDRRIHWKEFLSALSRTLDETLFAPESHDAPIQIAGPAESAGLTADAIWMMGASEDQWPANGSTNPLLPFDVQRESAMPHASPQLDWDLAQAITARLAASALEVHFSYARQVDGVAVRPSRLVERIAGSPLPIPAELIPPSATEPRTERFEDFSRIPLPSARAVGGSTILTSQSQCPFKAFASARLNAQGWEPAQAGLTAVQRGQLLHSVLNSVWAGEPDGIGTHKDLTAISDLSSFVERHVRQAQAHPIYIAACKFMPHRYLELEAVRLTRLVTEWLEYERTRAAFTVIRTELDTDATVAGLELRLRMDRIDRLNDGSLLVIDYKSGDVSPSLWDLPRPEDVQVPLYVGFALSEQLRETLAREPEKDASKNAKTASSDEPTASDESAGRIGGLVFARVRPGDVCFAGRVGNAQATLLPGLSARSALIQNPFSAEDLIAWRDYIEQMAKDFIVGRAVVDPRTPDTCKYCDLQSLCRIQELQPNIQEQRLNEEEAQDD